MGARKRLMAERLKEQRKNKAYAILRDLRMSPRKVRLIADLIRGLEVNEALNILKFSTKHASMPMEKLLVSAIANWQSKNPDAEMADLYVKEVYVDQSRTLKRIQPAPHGRAHRIRKRSSHVTIVVDTMENLKKDNKKEENNNKKEDK